MFQLSVNEAVTGALPLPIPPGLKIDEGFGSGVRGLDEQERLRSDLKLAMAVQRQMLPRNRKQLATIRYAGTSTAAGGIGGDYYDFLDLGPGSLGVLLADVSGKGLPAALLTANLQAWIRCECARGLDNVCAMLERVNAHLLESTLPQHYATLFFGEYHDKTRRLDYVNCAQQPAIIVRRDGSIEPLETTAMPLGLLSRWSGEKKTVELGRGDTVCVCSDGVVEAGLDSGYEFGEERLHSLVAESADQDIEGAVAGVAQAAHLYALNGPTDDMTVLGIRAV
ncbi:MAG: PP2C family protein-serine/threonine phosphatase [Bryobacteraceae bacterium]